MKFRILLVGTALSCSASMAYASDFGCKVLLCLANPNGPTAVAECVPPITQLWDELAHFRPFPTCDMANGNGGESYAKQGMSYYDTCPTRTTPLAQGTYAVQGSPQKNKLEQWKLPLYAGIGSGDSLIPGQGEDNNPLPGKVCVGTLLGTGQVIAGSPNNKRMVQVGFYERVVMLSPQRSPRVIDVYVNNQLYRRVRW